MRTEIEIIERIKHIETLRKGYGINDARIKELKWVLKDKNFKMKNENDIK